MDAKGIAGKSSYELACEKRCEWCARGTVRLSQQWVHKVYPKDWPEFVKGAFSEYFPCAAPTPSEYTEELRAENEALKEDRKTIEVGKRVVGGLGGQRLAEIEARAALATRGTWKNQLTQVMKEDLETNDCKLVWVQIVCAPAPRPCNDFPADKKFKEICELNIQAGEETADAEFIAHAHQDIPDLIAEIRNLKGWLAEFDLDAGGMLSMLDNRNQKIADLTQENEALKHLLLIRGPIDSGSPEDQARERIIKIGHAETERQIADLTRERDEAKEEKLRADGKIARLDALCSMYMGQAATECRMRIENLERAEAAESQKAAMREALGKAREKITAAIKPLDLMNFNYAQNGANYTLQAVLRDLAALHPAPQPAAAAETEDKSAGNLRAENKIGQ